MISKYGFKVEKDLLQKDKKRLINQMWKLIPMRENEEDWQGQINVLIEEISGLAEIFKNNLDCFILLCKLEGLTSEVCEDFMIYRKTVFRCIELIARVLDE